MAQLIYWSNSPLPAHAICACGEDRKVALRDDGHGGWTCGCCAAPPEDKRMARCPHCGRANAPYEEHHRLGQRLHKVLGLEHETEKICLNCHMEITAYMLPLYRLQRLLFGQNPEKTIWSQIAALIFALFVEASYAAFSSEDPYVARECREFNQFVFYEFRSYGNAHAL